jgi:hypothetical protein
VGDTTGSVRHHADKQTKSQPTAGLDLNRRLGHQHEHPEHGSQEAESDCNLSASLDAHHSGAEQLRTQHRLGTVGPLTAKEHAPSSRSTMRSVREKKKRKLAITDAWTVLTGRPSSNAAEDARSSQRFARRFDELMKL